MLLRKGQLPILVANVCALIAFTVFVVSRGSYGLLSYVGVIGFFFILILATNRKVAYPNSVLWGLTLWVLLHLLGGSVPVNETTLYATILIPLSKTYPVFRYDQFVHMIGIGVATLVMYHLLQPLLKPELQRWKARFVVVAMAGMGVGAMNELIEFVATQVAPKTGVGGYTNTCLDLAANLVGVILALIFLRIAEKRTA